MAGDRRVHALWRASSIRVCSCLRSDALTDAENVCWLDWSEQLLEGCCCSSRFKPAVVKVAFNNINRSGEGAGRGSDCAKPDLSVGVFKPSGEVVPVRRGV